VGIVVPKYKHSGVERNLVKRRLRELSRTRLLPALADRPADVTLRALPSAYDASFDVLARDVERAVADVRRLPRPSGGEGPTA
jgi:ribonuclease P protein component